MEVLGALASVLTIWLVTGILVYEAVNRVINPVPVNGKREPLPPGYIGDSTFTCAKVFSVLSAQQSASSNTLGRSP